MTNPQRILDFNFTMFLVTNPETILDFNYTMYLVWGQDLKRPE